MPRHALAQSGGLVLGVGFAVGRLPSHALAQSGGLVVGAGWAAGRVGPAYGAWSWRVVCAIMRGPCRWHLLPRYR